MKIKNSHAILISPNTRKNISLTAEQKNITITLKEGAFLVVYDQGCVHTASFYLEKNATLHFFTVITKSVSRNIKVFLNGHNARAYVNGVYLLDGKKKVSLKTVQEHNEPGAHSHLVLRGVIAGHACMNHEGNIFVEKKAEKTVAQQNNKTIMLSPTARIKSLPALEVYNKNVRCSHGTAAGSFDQQHLFYLRSRGLSEEHAKQIFLEVFLTLPFSGLDDKTIKKKFSECITKKLQEMV